MRYQQDLQGKIRREGKTVFSGKTTQAENLHVPLTPGTYEVQVQKDGFYSANAEKVTVVTGQVTPLEQDSNMRAVRRQGQSIGLRSSSKERHAN